MDDLWLIILIFIGFFAVFAGLVFLIMKVSMKHAIKSFKEKSKPPEVAEEFQQTEENAWIIDASPTGLMINKMPVLKLKLRETLLSSLR